MNWLKVKTEHISPEYTNAEVGALIRFQIFIARYGRFPTDKEIQKDIGKKDFNRLKDKLSKLEVDLKMIQRKVEEDREKIQRKREVSQNTSRRHRDSKKCDTSPSLSRDATDKIREDKSILNKSKAFKAPMLEEVVLYAKEKNREDLANKFFDYYKEGDWHDANGKKLKNWKQKFITWTNKNADTKQEFKGFGVKL